jgi:hypothetical protein
MEVDAISIINRSGGMVGLSGSGGQVSSSGGEVNEQHRGEGGPEAPKCNRLDKD